MGWLCTDPSVPGYYAPPSSSVILAGSVVDNSLVPPSSSLPIGSGGSSGNTASGAAAAGAAAAAVAAARAQSRTAATAVSVSHAGDESHRSKGNDTANIADKASVRGGGGDGGPTLSKMSPSTPPARLRQLSSEGSSPWRWQQLEAETTGWLPGDLLSLWVRLDYHPQYSPYPHHITAAGGSGSGGGDGIGGDGGDGGPGQAARGGDIMLSPEFRRSPPPPPCVRVRAFELTLVDDARADAIASRARGCFRRRYFDPASEKRAGLGDAASGRGRDGNAREVAAAVALREAGGGTGAGCSVPPSYSAAAEGGGGGGAGGEGDWATARGCATVQLDFAAVCPMNLAAAGGTWA